MNKDEAINAAIQAITDSFKPGVIIKPTHFICWFVTADNDLIPHGTTQPVRCITDVMGKRPDYKLKQIDPVCGSPAQMIKEWKAQDQAKRDLKEKLNTYFAQP